MKGLWDDQPGFSETFLSIGGHQEGPSALVVRRLRITRRDSSQRLVIEALCSANGRVSRLGFRSRRFEGVDLKLAG